MRSTQPFLFATLVTSALAAGCPPEVVPPPPDAGPVGQCVIEANAPLDRGVESAVPLEVGASASDTLCPQRDNDGYRVTVAAPESVLVVTLAMETNITNVEPVYEIVRDNGDGSTTAVGGGADPLAEGASGHITNFTGLHRVELAGDYIVIVRDKDGFDDTFDNVNAYTLTVDVVADPDVNEPNNLPEQAAPIAAGETQGIIATVGDDDWYAIEAPGNAQIIDVTLTVPLESGIEHVATLLLSDALTVLQQEAFVAVDTDGDGTDDAEQARIRQRVTGTAGTPFLLLVEDGGADGDQDSNIDPAIAKYTLELAVIADPDVNEGATGNDSETTFTAVTDGASITAAVASFNDQDVYRVVPPAGTTANNPRVLVVEIAFDGALGADFQPQVRALTGDPERSPIPACAATCDICYDGKCGEARLQRFITGSPFRSAVPLRNTEPIFIVVNEFNDDAFQEAGGYTISFAIEDDTDPGEVGDDFLIPNLEEAGYANRDDLNEQRDESKARARQRPAGFPPVCDEATPTGVGCLDRGAPSNPVGADFPDVIVDCADAEAGARSVTMSGRLTYEGDRDYFLVPDFPALGYFGMELDIETDRATPVELAVFVHGNNGSALAGSTLIGAAETGGCREEQGGQNACAAGSICVDERCWTDGPSNIGVTDTFGDGPDECVVMLHDVNVEAPVYVEIVDNGINDFDLDMTYTVTLTMRCGCPANCDNGQDFCQNGP